MFHSALVLFAMLPTLASQASPDVQVPVAATFDDATFETLWSQVVPAANELAWQQIAWRSVLADAAREAQATDKPILLWAMNGHPLGCT